MKNVTKLIKTMGNRVIYNKPLKHVNKIQSPY